MRLNRNIIWGILVILFSTAVGQTVCPTVPDFMDLNSPCVVCNYGNTSNPFLYTGLADMRHTRITEQGFDANTGGKLPLIPEGDSVSIRLGNSQIGAEAEAITYHFNVQRDRALLSVRFAVVFEDPGHAHSEQPRFMVRILNNAGKLVETCAEYDVTASAGIPGFETYSGMGVPVRWRPWTTIALDLSDYIGQDIKVQFVNYDCTLHGHFGYAYFTAECLPSKLDLTVCSNANDTIELSAPPFCEAYLWTNGDTTSSTKFIKQGSDPITASCLITSVTGCEFTLNAYIFDHNPFANDTVIYDTICEGEPYTKNYFNLLPQYGLGTSTHINSFFDMVNCSGTITVLLNLTVIKRYYHIEEAICYGEDYIDNGFTILKPAVGIVHDTLVLSNPQGCDTIRVLKLIVSYSNLSFPETILGNSEPCSGEVETYTLPDAEFFTNFSWTVPHDVHIIGAANAAKIVLQFSEEAVADTLKLYAENGCGSGHLSLFVEPHLSYYLSFSDSICSGLPYTKNGFNIPRQDSAGFKIFSQIFTTQDGCDSVRSLYLYTFPSPMVEIRSSEDVICEDDSVELRVISASGRFEISEVKIGDILCADGSILDTAEFKLSGKTAEGVVFWISPDETHCWVADLDEYHLRFGPTANLLSGVTTLTSSPIFDTAGYQNTLAIRNSGDASTYPSAWVADFDNGWFLPAVTQARILFGSIPFINESFAIAGGTPFSMHLYLDPLAFPVSVVLQSSTQYNENNIWTIVPSGHLFPNDPINGTKSFSLLVRFIRYVNLNR